MTDQSAAPAVTGTSGTDDDLRIALFACKRILLKLQLLSDAPTQNLSVDGQVVGAVGSAGLRTREKHGFGVKGGRTSTSRMPEGVRGSAGGHESAPSKRFSLWGHYSWRMQRALEARDAGKLHMLAVCATRDYQVESHERPGFHPSHGDAVAELLKECTGVPAVEASWQLGASVEWVRRQRTVNGRDPELGEPRGPDRRMERILALHAAGASTRAIAEEVGVGKSQVQRLLNGRVSGNV